MKQWIKVAPILAFAPNSGGCVKHGELQIAVFNLGHGRWYATQNLCPHNQQMVLSRGLVGSANGTPKVACPLHKNSFALDTGEHLGGNGDWKLETYPVMVADGWVHLWLEPVEQPLETAKTLSHNGRLP